MEKLFLSPAKAALYNLEPFRYLLGGSSESGGKKLRPVQSLAAESSPSQTAKQSPPPPPQTHLVAMAQGSELAGRCWAGEAQGRVVQRTRNPLGAPDLAGSSRGSALASQKNQPLSSIRAGFCKEISGLGSSKEPPELIAAHCC